MMAEVYRNEGYALIGAAFEVYNEKGHGFLEEVYHECMELELGFRGIPFDSKPELSLYYKGNRLTKFYLPDLQLYDGLIAELKAVRTLTDDHRAQLINYLRAARKRVGYLINFGHSEKLEWQRFVIDLK